MLKKALFAATSIAALAASPAFAGELDSEIVNVNNRVNSSPKGEDTNSRGTTCGGGGGLNADHTCGHTSQYTIDSTEGWYVGDVHNPIPVVIFAKERFVSQAHPAKAHYEIDLYDKEDIFPSESEIGINIFGGAFKAGEKGTNLSPNMVIRAGRDNTRSESAFSSLPLVAGTSSADFLLQSDLPERAVGFVLPLMFTTPDDCDLMVQFRVARQVAGIRFEQTTDPLQLATCKHSLETTVAVKDVHVDYRQSFKGFLVPYGKNEHGKETFTQQLYADIGAIHVDIHNTMVDAKQPVVENDDIRDRYFEASDISRWEVTLQFENLVGIKSVELVNKDEHAYPQPVKGVVDYDNGLVTFDITDTDLEGLLATGKDCAVSYSELYNAGHGGGGMKQKCDVHVRVHAWGKDKLSEMDLKHFPKGSVLPPKKENDGKTVLIPDGKGPNGEKLFRSLTVNGAIQHQEVYLVQNAYTLSPNETDDPHAFDDGKVKFDSPKLLSEGSLIGKLKVNGQVFGPFDWVADTSLPVRSAFRMTHLPATDGHGNPIEVYEGVMTLKNSSAGSQYDGDYKVSIPAADVTNGEVLVMPGRMTSFIEDAGGPTPARWGRTDVTFNWFIESTKVDMDRLLNTSGTFADFGDAGNDSNSVHAISGDEGRFGPKKGGKIIVNDCHEASCSGN